MYEAISYGINYYFKQVTLKYMKFMCISKINFLDRTYKESHLQNI